jgi:large subunit ribosomal protein L28
MAYKCDICGKGKQFGHNVSFSQRKTQKISKPNLQRQHVELAGTRMQIKVCTQCLRTLKKYRQADTAAKTTSPESPIAAANPKS